MDIQNDILALRKKKINASLQVRTMGTFEVINLNSKIENKEWGRDKTIQLFQFFITSRHRRALHKEQIIDRLWEDVDTKAGDQNFKVALHGINKVLEPDRKSRTEAKYILRQGLTYQLNLKEIWIDVDALEQYVAIGNQAYSEYPQLSKEAYQEAIDLHEGIYLPNRLYEDWSSEERERIQVLILNAIMALCELIYTDQPMECIRLAQKAIQIDRAWEEAYRIQMKAYIINGNRPMAIKTYNKCIDVLEEEFGIEPLPETKAVMKDIMEI